MSEQLTPINEAPTQSMDTAVTTVHEQSLPQETRWDRLKRGFWKHMYETPVDMSPMGPTIQPDIPFDEWYAQKHEGEPGKLGRAFNKTADKVTDLAGKTAENIGYATAYVDYLGNTALINTADAVTLTAKRAAAGMENATRKVDDTGNTVLMGMGYHAANAKEKTATRARQLAGGAERFTRKTDNAGNAAMEDIAFQATMGAEFAAETAREARRIGGLALNKIGIPESLRESLRMKYPIQRKPDQRQPSDSWDWDED
jgi:hypothetical protein